MKKAIISTATLLYACCIFHSSAAAASSWKLFGIKDEYVMSLLPMPPAYDDDAIFVGTASGIWWHAYERWFQAWQGTAVYGMIQAEEYTPVAVAENGPDSDGVYVGKVVAIGEPGILWEFSLQAEYTNPTAIAFRRGNDSCIDAGTIYVGNSEGVSSCFLCNGVIDPLQVIPTPEIPFGYFCSALCIFSGDGMLYGGGYGDFRISKAKAAPSIPAYLCRGTTELTPLMECYTVAIIETIVADEPFLAVATPDSILLLQDGQVRYTISSPLTNEPVVDLIPFTQKTNTDGKEHTILAIATPSHVFIQASPDVDAEWRAIPDIPARVTCLGQQNGKILWAGTDSGLYRCEISPVALYDSYESVVSGKHTTMPIRSGKGTLYFNRNLPNGCLLTLFDSRGRCVKKDIHPVKKTVIDNLGKGMYLYRLHSGNKAIVTGRVPCY